MVATPDIVGGVLLTAWIVYGLTGGADFGGGVWDLLARGPRAKAQRALIDDAIGPIWEANHVWLIFIVVLLFTTFPMAFSVASTALHIPLLVVLVGIAARGSAFAFRKHDSQRDERYQRWSLVFGVASLLTPFFLGITLAATVTGAIRVDEAGGVTTGFLAGWTHPFAWFVGAFAVAMFAYLAAVYLTIEAHDQALREDFRTRALVTGVALGPAAFALLAATRWWAPVLWNGLTGPVGIALVTAASAAGVGAVVSLWRRRYEWARGLAAGQVALVLAGWGWAQRPHLIAPDVTLETAAAPELILRVFLGVTLVGSAVLLPSLWYLFRVFKGLGPALVSEREGD